jgi:3-deoxy-7-phosphoheptulonate synthase
MPTRLAVPAAGARRPSRPTTLSQSSRRGRIPPMGRHEPLDDRNVSAVVPLVPPRAVKASLPTGLGESELVRATRAAIRDLLHGRDRDRLLVVVGPCSIHDPDAALDYASRLRDVARATEDELLVVMRTYFEKPRTTVGWKGLINDPHLDGSCDVARGLEVARRILLDVNRLGVPCGSELLDPITPQYVADLLSWAAIGARTTESQTHREMASGLSMPVGFKNGTDGGVQVALDAMVSARHPHTFVGIDVDGVTSAVRTRGNPDRHIVLRGGRGRTNHGREDVARAAAMVAGEGIARPVMIDCSHGNSGKDPSRQLVVAREVLEQVRDGQEALVGLLVESNLVAGRQDWKPGATLAYGVSITDACLGWEDTARLLEDAAAAVAARRHAG